MYTTLHDSLRLSHLLKAAPYPARKEAPLPQPEPARPARGHRQQGRESACRWGRPCRGHWLCQLRHHNRQHRPRIFAPFLCGQGRNGTNVPGALLAGLGVGVTVVVVVTMLVPPAVPADGEGPAGVAVLVTVVVPV